MNKNRKKSNNADIISYEEYHPFGTTSYRSGRDVTEVSLKRYKYVGKERDNETGLYYYGARYYADWIARWISPDPAGTVDAPSLYVYVKNNPVKLTDPSGMQTEDEVDQVHKVEKGETLYGIAKKYNTTVDELYKNNPDLPEDPTKLQIGTEIKISKNELVKENDVELKYKKDGIPIITGKDYLNEFLSVFRYFVKNKYKKGHIAITDLVCFSCIASSGKFEHKISQISDLYISKDDSKPTAIIQHKGTELIRDIYIINYSNLDIDIDRAENKLKYRSKDKYYYRGKIQIVIPSYDPENIDNYRKTGLQLFFDISDPEQLKMFKLFNRELGGLKVKKEYNDYILIRN